MDSDKKKTLYKVIIGVVLIILLIVFEFIFINRIKEQTKKEVLSTITREIVTDTISITDTIIKSKTKLLYKDRVDTFIILQEDTIVKEILVEIPIEHKQYIDTLNTDSGSFNIDIIYSGYKANIDNLNLSYKSIVTPREVDKNDWRQFIGLGLALGYGVDLKTPQFAPNVSIVLTYGWGYTFKSKK